MIHAISKASSSHDISTVKVVLPLATYRRVTWLTICVHLVCATFLFGTAQIYWIMGQPYMEYFAGLLENPNITLWAIVFGCMGSFHILSIIGIIFEQCIDPQLDLKTTRGRAMTNLMKIRRSVAPLATLQSSESVQQSGLSFIAFYLIHWIQRIHRATMGRQGLLGIASPHFDLVYFTREIIEIASQIYQAYRISFLITREWINLVAVILIILNCWSTPLFRYFFRHSLKYQRLAFRMGNLILNVGSSMMIPAIIFIPYIFRFNIENYQFDNELLYNDILFGAMVMENRFVFVSDTIDGLSKITPHLSIYIAIRGLYGLCQPAGSRPRISLTRSLSTIVISSQTNRLSMVLKACIHVITITTSIIILVLHVQARRITDIPIGCRQSIYPWFSTNYACSIYEFNCYRHNVSTPSIASFDRLEPASLSILLLTHCTNLMVPPSIRTFPNLIGFEIYNSTIVEWNADAAIETGIHDQMNYMQLIYINMSHFPPGLLQPLPQLLTDIEISVTNLTILPDEMGQQWKDVTVLYIEHSQFVQFPSVLLGMKSIYDLSLIGNEITTLSNVTLDGTYFWISLSKNPLMDLPLMMKESTSIGFLSLEYTLLESLPAWCESQVNEKIYLYGTPYCTQNTRSRESFIECQTSYIIDANGRYPLSITAPLRIP